MPDSDLKTEPPIATGSSTRVHACCDGGLRSALVITLLALVMHLPWLGLAPIAGTEGQRIFPARAMVQSGWWSVPMLFGRPYLSKPPLHYWLIGISEVVFRHGSLYAWRFPSVVTGALLCGVCGWFAARWFGRIPGWISGFCAIGLITLWGQNHVADIDATNTLATALATFCGIELLIVRSRRSAGWIITAGLALAATLLTKGPGGLPIIAGVWLWSVIAPTARGEFTVHHDRSGGGRLLISPRFWLPWLIAIAVFATWIVTATHALHVRNLPVDWRGAQEGTRSLHAHSLGALMKSLYTLPPQLFAFALPVSLAFPLFGIPAVRRAMGDGEYRLAAALFWSVLLSWLICVLASMQNPRYGYPTLLPLCPLAGALAVAASRSERSRPWLGIASSGSAILFFGGSVVLTKLGWPTTWGRPLLISTLALELVVVVWTIWKLQRSWYGAWGIALLAVLTVFPFSIHEQIARIAASGVGTAVDIHRIVGAGGPLAVSGGLTSKPEAFYYAGVDLRFYKTDFTPATVAPGCWVVLDPIEYKLWKSTPSVKLDSEQWLCKWGQTRYRIAWYAAR